MADFGGYTRLIAPARIGIGPAELKATLGYLHDIRTSVLIREQPVFLDMRHCEHISPAGCIMLAAEVDRCNTLKTNHVNGQYPLMDRPRATMAQFGFHEALKFNRPRASRARRPAIRIHSGPKAPVDQGPSIQSTSSMADDLFGDSGFGGKVGIAISEAMENVQSHAFDLSFPEDPYCLRGRWWMAGLINRERKEASFYVLDHGPGIPIVASKKWSHILQDYWNSAEASYKPRGAPEDRDVLNAVALARKSGVDTGSHGRGFKTMIDLIDQWSESGSVQVVSGSARFSLNRPRKGAESRARCYRLVNPFPGTLISWKIAAPRHIAAEV